MFRGPVLPTLSYPTAMHLFTYGTLQFPEVWREVCGREFATVAGEARDYVALRVRGALFPGLTPETGATTPGQVVLDIDETALFLLDAFENAPYYDRQELQVTCADGQVRTAFAYVVPTEHRGSLTSERWTAEEFLARGDLARFLATFGGFDRLREMD